MIDTASSTAPTGLARIGWAVSDGWELTVREFGHVRRAPGELLGLIIFPGLMVIMFGYVFGSAIQAPGGGNYREYLMPGLYAMTALTGVMVSALAVAKDVENGVMDRFRSLPMARSAVPVGRTVAELVYAVPAVAIMAGIGVLVGWRIHHGVLAALAGFGLLLLLKYATSWIGVFVGLSVSAKTADAFVPIVFPVLMISNAFVPTTGMPVWLATIADWNPVSALVAALRELFGNPAMHTAHLAWPMAHPVIATVGWFVVLLAVFVPLAAWRYRTSTR